MLTIFEAAGTAWNARAAGRLLLKGSASAQNVGRRCRKLVRLVVLSPKLARNSAVTAARSSSLQRRSPNRMRGIHRRRCTRFHPLNGASSP